ncbi:hypothetical protein PCE1_003076 [Barthelona sp. PCE]
MGRLQACKSKGSSASAIPFSRRAPAWFKASPESIIDQIVELAKKGLTPSQIGVVLRDTAGVGQVSRVTGSKILRILKARGYASEIPEDLFALIRKALNLRRHFKSNGKDTNCGFQIVLVESRIHRLARYYRRVGKLPPTWRYNSKESSTLIA